MTAIDETLKARADELGVTLKQEGSVYEAVYRGKQYAMGSDPTSVLQKALGRLAEAATATAEIAPAAEGAKPAQADAAPVPVKKAARKATPAKVTAAKAKPEKVAAAKKASAKAKPAAQAKPKAEPKVKAADGGASIIKSKYKDKYKKHGYSCGDAMAKALKELVTDGKGKEASVDVAKLRKIAVKNGVWNDKYLTMNVGMQRMNVGNRLRNKLKAGEQVIVGEHVFKP